MNSRSVSKYTFSSVIAHFNIVFSALHSFFIVMMAHSTFHSERQSSRVFFGVYFEFFLYLKEFSLCLSSSVSKSSPGWRL